MADTLVKRDIFDEISPHLEAKEISILVGARQTGKTTLLYQLKDYLLGVKRNKKTQIFFFNLDLMDDLTSVRDQHEFIKFLKEELSKEQNLFIFIDEVQRLQNPGKFLKGIYDLNMPVKFVVSGSSSLEIKSHVFESLAGRKRIFYIWPFSFREYLSFHNASLLDLLPQKQISSINKTKLFDYLYDFIVFGGYPKVVLSKNKEEKIKILEEIYSSYIEKDIVGFMKIKNPFAFSKLIQLLANQIGNLVNIKELSNSLSLNFRTVENYIFALENTFVVSLVRPYFTNPRKELTKMPKVYFNDTGLRNLSVKYFANFLNNRDKGRLLENFAYCSFLKSSHGTVNYWRTKDKSEVDFILKDYYGNIIPVEIKAKELKKPEINKSLRSFLERYGPDKGIVANLSLEKEETFKKTKIKFLLPHQLSQKLF